MRLFKTKAGPLAGIFFLGAASAFSLTAAPSFAAEPAETAASAWNAERVKNEIDKIAANPAYSKNEFQPLWQAIRMDSALKQAAVAALAAQLAAPAPSLFDTPGAPHRWKDALFMLSLIRRDAMAGAEADSVIRTTYLRTVPLIKSGDPQIRAGAVYVAGNIGSDTPALTGPAFGEIKPALQDKDPHVQSTAVNLMPLLAKGNRSIALAALGDLQAAAMRLQISRDPQADLVMSDIIYAVSRLAENQPDLNIQAQIFLSSLTYGTQGAEAVRAIISLKGDPGDSFRAISSLARGSQRNAAPDLLVDFVAVNPAYAQRSLNELARYTQRPGMDAAKAFNAVTAIAASRPDLADFAKGVLQHSIDEMDPRDEGRIQAAKDALEAISAAPKP